MEAIKKNTYILNYAYSTTPQALWLWSSRIDQQGNSIEIQKIQHTKEYINFTHLESISKELFALK